MIAKKVLSKGEARRFVGMGRHRMAERDTATNLS